MRIPLQRQLNTRPSGEPLRAPEFSPTAEMLGARVGESLQGLAANTMALGQIVRQQEEEKQRFSAMQQFTAFSVEQRKMLEEAKRANQPGNTGFYETAQKTYADSERKFIASLPPELQDEFKVRAAELGGTLSLDAVKYQYETNDTYFKQGLQDGFTSSKVELGQDGSVENLEKQRQWMHEQIDASGLSQPEKVAIRRSVDAGLEAVAYKQAQLQRLRDEQSGLRSALTGAVDLLDTSGLTDLQAQEAAQKGQAIAIGSFGAQSVDTWNALPMRIQSVLIATAAQKGKLPGSIVAAVTNGDMEELIAALRKEGLENEADTMLNPSSSIDNNPAFANVPYEDRVTLTADAERDIAGELSDARAASKAQENDLVNQMKVALYDGNAGQSDIDALRAKLPNMNYEDIKSMQDILAKRDEELRLRQRGAAFMDGSATYAPGNEEDKKVLDAMVGDKGLEAIDSMDADYAANTLLPLVRQTGAIPDKAKDLIGGMIRSTDPQKAYWALDLMSQLEQAAPKGYMQFSQDDRMDVDLWQVRKDYMNQEDLMALIRGPQDPAQRNAEVALREEGRKLFTTENGPMKNYNPADAFKFGGFLGIGQTTPSMPSTKWSAEAMESDFQSLFLDHYSKTGDVEAAKKAANTELQRVWGVTNTGADAKLMKFAPEKVYPQVAGSYDWMEAQLRRDGIVQPDEQFELISDYQTGQEVGKMTPSYILALHTDEGTKIQFMPDGSPKRVFFDVGEVEQADEQGWREQNKQLIESESAGRIVSDGLKKTLEEGTTVPDELFNEYVNSGLLQQMMQKEQAAGGQPNGPFDGITEAAPVAIRVFTATVMGDRSPITEGNFRPDELGVLKAAVLKAEAEGKNVIGYGDYGESDFNTASSRDMLQDVSNLGTSVANTIGMAKFHRDAEGNVIIEDEYDFAATRESMQKHVDERGGIPQVLMDGFVSNGMRGVGNVIGNLTVPKGEGRKVRINLGKI